jgi:hypothetical protein
MADFYPTKTWLALLSAVNAGDVVDGPDEHGTIHAWLRSTRRTRRDGSTTGSEMRCVPAG